jgi:hypothetical protein
MRVFRIVAIAVIFLSMGLVAAAGPVQASFGVSPQTTIDWPQFRFDDRHDGVNRHETFSDPCVTGTFENEDIHLDGLPQGALGWNAFTGNIQFNIPAASRDVHGYDLLQFRTEVNPRLLGEHRSRPAEPVGGPDRRIRRDGVGGRV